LRKQRRFAIVYFNRDYLDSTFRENFSMTYYLPPFLNLNDSLT
jgi:hypothetical protein